MTLTRLLFAKGAFVAGGFNTTRDVASKLPEHERAQYLTWVDQLEAAMIVAEPKHDEKSDPNASTEQKQPCLQCGKPATLRCSRCKDPPISYTSDPKPAYYCDKGCQKKHWKTHDPVCHRMVSRKALYRAGDFLQELFYMRFEEGYPFQIDSLEQKGEEVHFHINGKPSEGDVYYKIEPSLFNGDIARFRKFLAVNNCSKALISWSPLVSGLLAGFIRHDAILEIDINYKGPGHQTFAYNAQRNKYATPGPRHEYWQVLLAEDEVYALDLTGAQFGWTETVMPWMDYERRSVKNYVWVNEIGFSTVDFMKQVGGVKPVSFPGHDWLDRVGDEMKVTMLLMHMFRMNERETDTAMWRRMLKMATLSEADYKVSRNAQVAMARRATRDRMDGANREGRERYHKRFEEAKHNIHPVVRIMLAMGLDPDRPIPPFG